MSVLSARLFHRLAQRRIRSFAARPTTGGGERTAGVSGSGLEFVEHRPYQPGDDLRHLDLHAFARFRTPHVKRFAADRGLDIALLLDWSSSMRVGDPDKAGVAKQLAAGIACAALAGGDRLRLATFGGGGSTSRHRPVTGLGRLDYVVANMLDGFGRGETDLLGVAHDVEEWLPTHGMVFVISDWWSDHHAEAIRALAGRNRELVAIHVLAEQEIEPEALGIGALRLQDAESGEALDANLDAAAMTDYRDAIERWCGGVRHAIRRVGGRYFLVRNTDDPEWVLLQRWLSDGLIG